MVFNSHIRKMKGLLKHKDQGYYWIMEGTVSRLGEKQDILATLEIIPK